MLKSVVIGSTILATSFLTDKLFKFNIKLTDTPVDTSRHAICLIFPMPNSKVQGIVSFSQENFSAQTKIVANVQGLSPNCTHGISINEFGDLTEGPLSLGKIYEPKILSNSSNNSNNNKQNQEDRVTGDLGFLKSDEKGNGYIAIKDKNIKLFGDQSIVGRSCVIFDSEESEQQSQSNSKQQVKGNILKVIGLGNIALSSIFKNFAPQV